MPRKSIESKPTAKFLRSAAEDTEDPQKRVAYRVRELPIAGPDMKSHFLRTYTAAPFVVGTAQFNWPEHLKPKSRRPKTKKSPDGSQ